MGTDIHIVAQKKTEHGWEDIKFFPFDWRSYGMFGFLADVRNYSAIPPLSQPRGLPDDYQAEDMDGYHSMSWLSVNELLAFNYDAEFEDRRVMINGDGGCTAEPGGGGVTTFRNFLGGRFFDDLNTLRDLGADRIVFWFDC